MHLEPDYARRTQAGDIVVHGVHAMLWALDLLAEQSALPAGRFTLTARFERFVYVNEPLEAWWSAMGERREIEIRSGDLRMATVSVSPAAPRPATTIDTSSTQPIPEKAIEWRMEEVAGLAGSFVPIGADEIYTSAFPAFVAQVGAGTVRALAGLSTLVGMICPGLHSIFSRLSIVVEPGSVGSILTYAVRRVQPILRLATMDIDGDALSGSVEAFVRHPPIRQPSMAELAGQVPSTLCRGDTVLVLGGSRGLGELTAKLTALAGAEVVISYARGRAEAKAVADEIVAGGGRCSVIRYDARAPVAEQLGTLVATVTHCYYYPTPQIFRSRGLTFDPEALARFTAIYNTAFADVATLLSRGSRQVRMFYPSSTAIDELPKGTLEYVMAKAAGESLCRYLDRSLPFLAVQYRRLPRLLTDQTSTVLPVATADSVAILRKIITDLHSDAIGVSKL